MTDLAALGRSHTTGFTGGVRREVVVVHVALSGFRRERVQLLLHAQHVQRRDTENLGLAALEERRSVYPRHHTNLARQDANVDHTTAEDADNVGQDAKTHELLGKRLVRDDDLLFASLEPKCQ